MTQSSRQSSHLHAGQAAVVIFALFIGVALTMGEARCLAQSAPPGDRSYALRLIVNIPPLAGTRAVYAIFGGSTSYALSAEGGGRYSLEAEAEANQNGGEIVLTNGGAEQRRDRITWTAYPGYRLTVEADYRQNPVGGLELDRVAQVVGTWQQVSAANGDQSQSDLISGGDAQPAAPTAIGSQQLAASDTAPAWAGGRGSNAPLAQARAIVTSTSGADTPRTTPGVAVNTTTTNGTLTPPMPHTPQTQGVAGLINAQNVLGVLVLMFALGALALPRILRQALATHTEDERDQGEDESEYQDDEADDVDNEVNNVPSRA